MKNQQTLRERLAVHYGNQKKEHCRLHVPAIGRIDKATIAELQSLAESARAGDNGARDRLFFALRPRLDRRSWMLKPWPNSDEMIGIWDRGDVRQETYLIFVEILMAWKGKGSFVPYLLATFNWRLRDRVLRGIGKRQTQLGTTRVSEGLLEELLVAEDGDQPESAAIARQLLEKLIRWQMMDDPKPGELTAWFELHSWPQTDSLVSPDHTMDSSDVNKQNRTA